MPIYENFARVYDTFMDNVPYKKWEDWIHDRLREAGIYDGLILDLGCGTGNLTQLLGEAGYDMIGVDMSLDMLQIAREKKERSGQDILYLCQDMCEFELYGTVRAVVCACDSLNYILEPEKLEQVFRLVSNYLDPGGMFLFDLNTEYKYRELLADHTFAESREDCSFIWDNYFDEETGINEYELTLFLTEKEDLCRRYREFHYQKAYSLETVFDLMEKAGLRLCSVYDDYSLKKPGKKTERICITAAECRKT